MAQQMGALERRVQPGASERARDDGVDAGGVGQPPVGGARTHEDLPGRATGASVSQVDDQRLSDIPGERQPLQPLALAPYQDFPRLPVEVLQPHRHHLAGPQAQPSEQQEKGIVPLSHRVAPITALQKLTDLLGGQRLGQARLPPSDHARDRLGQVEGDVTTKVQEAQEGAQPRHDHLGVAATALASARARVVKNESGHVLRLHLVERQWARAKARGQEGAGDRQMPRDGRVRQTALLDEIADEPVFEATTRGVLHLHDGDGQSAGVLQMSQEQSEGRRCATLDVLAAFNRLCQKLGEPRLVHRLDAEPETLQPLAQLSEQHQISATRLPSVAPLHEDARKAVQVRP